MHGATIKIILSHCRCKETNLTQFRLYIKLLILFKEELLLSKFQIPHFKTHVKILLVIPECKN